MGVIARATDAGDRELVAAVRAGDDAAFEELYRRYSRRVAGYVCRMVGDVDRAEDVTQEAFFSALRRLRRTDSDIVFKPWIFEIAKNASIDHFRRTSRAEEVSLQADEGLRPADHLRLLGGGPAPDTAYEGKERLENLRGAFDELSDSHTRILVLRELEGLSYREIGERMELTRPAVESTLFRARRRLNEEYADLDTGARCEAVGAAIARLAEGMQSARDRRRVSRHVARCSPCRRHARELGVAVDGPMRTRVAALLPLPALTRRRRGATHDGGAATAAGGYGSGIQSMAGTWAPTIVTAGAAEGTASAWGKAVAIVATLALAGGGAAIQDRIVSPERGTPATQKPAPVSGSDTEGPRHGTPAGAGVNAGDGGSIAGQGGQPGADRRDAVGGLRGGDGYGGGDIGVPRAPDFRAPEPGASVSPPGVQPPAVAPPDGGAVLPRGDAEVPDVSGRVAPPDAGDGGVSPLIGGSGIGAPAVPTAPAAPTPPAYDLPPVAGPSVAGPGTPAAPSGLPPI